MIVCVSEFCMSISEHIYFAYIWHSEDNHQIRCISSLSTIWDKVFTVPTTHSKLFIKQQNTHYKSSVYLSVGRKITLPHLCVNFWFLHSYPNSVIVSASILQASSYLEYISLNNNKSLSLWSLSGTNVVFRKTWLCTDHVVNFNCAYDQGLYILYISSNTM